MYDSDTELMGSTRIVAVLFALNCMAPSASTGQILSPNRAFGKYQQFIWQDQHGLPQNSVYAIARTRDGYLWLATLEGLARFDGVRFTVFDSGNTPAITNNLAIALIEDRADGLWMGTDGGGLVRYLEGRFTQYTSQHGLANDHVMSLLQDRAGTLWVGTDGGGLSRFVDGRFTSYRTADGLPSDHVWALAEDASGAIWIGTSRGLARMRDDRFTVYTRRDGLPDDEVRSLKWDSRQTLWIGTASGGLSRFSDGQFTSYGADAGVPSGRIAAVYHDREGTLWIGAERGLSRMTDGRFVPYATREGQPLGPIRSIFQDPDGDFWIGSTASGLVQLRDPRFRTFTTDDGLAGEFVTAVFGDRAGRVWVSTNGGVNHFDVASERSERATSVIPGLPSAQVRAITEDPAGHLWLGSRDGLFRWANDRLTHWTTREGLAGDNVFVVRAARDGTIWIGSLSAGLSRFRNGQFTTYTTREGLPDNDVVSLYEDRAGRLWVGTRRGGIARLDAAGVKTWSTRDGLGHNQVLAFYEDRAGAMWIGTHGGGLTRFKNGEMRTVTSNNGLYDNLAFAMLEDGDGNLWMSGNRGIYRARLQELNDVADGRIAAVSSFAYGVADGMLSRECNGAQPAGWKTEDGTLWFPTSNGVVTIDPTRRETGPPLVAIETIAIDRVPVPSGQPIRLTPGQRDLEIAYTALSWRRPSQVRFKYRIAGLDDDWIDVGTRRTAYYSRLPPGAYTFTVIADNGEGVWNTEGKSLAVLVVPAFYQTRAFVILAFLGGAALLAWAWHFRVRQLQRGQRAQQAFSSQLIASQEGERKRIAAELHDSLGQSLLVIKNQTALGALQHPNTDVSARFTEIKELAARTIDEIREISWNLRPSHLDQLGLRTALIVMTERMAAAGRIVIEHDIDDLHGLLSAGHEITVYRIAQECLNNVVKHSGATRAFLSIHRRDRILEVKVHDSGRGFAARVTAPALSQSGFGLTGVSERVRMLGGTHTIASAPGQGTTVTVKLPITHDRPTHADE